MMNAIRINNVAKPFPSRQAARDWSNENGGKVVDLAKHFPHFVEMQITCQNIGYQSKNSRWIVVFDRIICLRHQLNRWVSPTVLGSTKVISKKGYQGNILRKNRLVKLNLALNS